MNVDSSKADFGAAVLQTAFGLHHNFPTDGVDETDEVAGLAEWLAKLKLTAYAEDARAWCKTAGAVDVDEVIECWEDFATDVKLRPLERKRVEKYVADKNCLEPNLTPQGAPSPSAPEIPCEKAEPCDVLKSFGPLEDPERYAILKEIGSGATAKVFRCRRSQDGQTFAAKKISLTKLKYKPIAEANMIYDMLHQEIAILFSLQHRRVVSLFDVVEETDYLHLIMEIVDGGSLEDYILTNGALLEEDASKFFYQIADGLKYIHSKGVVHQDLKPDNILLCSDVSGKGVRQVKLTDFGHSKVVDEYRDSANNRGTVGTPLYSAPEVSDVNQENDSSVDLWSLGVVLYVMLVGSCPFAGSGVELERQIQKGTISFWSDDDKPPPGKEAQLLVKALLRVDPKKRLAIDWCLVHPFVAGSGALLRRLLTLGQCDGDLVEDRYWLPPQRPLSDQQARDLRQRLQKWMVKFRYSAIMKRSEGTEVVATYGNEENVDWTNVQAAHGELLQIMKEHWQAYRPSGGTAKDGIARFQKQCAAEMSQPDETVTIPPPTMDISVNDMSQKQCAAEISQPDETVAIPSPTMDISVKDVSSATLQTDISGKNLSRPVAVHTRPRSVEPETETEAAARQQRLEARKERAQNAASGKKLAIPVDQATEGQKLTPRERMEALKQRSRSREQRDVLQTNRAPSPREQRSCPPTKTVEDEPPDEDGARTSDYITDAQTDHMTGDSPQRSSLGHAEDEAAARQRRMEARKQKAATGVGPKWNFGGKVSDGQVNDRLREHESMLDQRRRLAYRARGDFKPEGEDGARDGA